MSLPIHLIRIIHERERWRTVRCSKPRDGCVYNTPAKGLPAPPLSPRRADDRDNKIIEEEPSHEARLYYFGAFMGAGRIVGYGDTEIKKLSSSSRLPVIKPEPLIHRREAGIDAKELPMPVSGQGDRLATIRVL